MTATPGAALTLVKSASPATVTAAGQTVTYTFLVTNTGNLTVRSLPSPTPSPRRPARCPRSPARHHAGAAAATTCTATYTTTQADVDNRSITEHRHRLGLRRRSGATIMSRAVHGHRRRHTRAPRLTVTKAVDADQRHRGRAERPVHLRGQNTGNVTVLTWSSPTRSAAPAAPANLSAITCPVTTARARRHDHLHRRLTRRPRPTRQRQHQDTATAHRPDPDRRHHHSPPVDAP